MTIDKVVKEGADRYRGFAWTRESGITTGVFQDQGIDIILYQEDGKKKSFMRCYSEPGFALFASLLNYHRHIYGSLPPLEDIQHLQGEMAPHYGEGYDPSFNFMEELIDMDVPELKDKKAVYPDGQGLLITGGGMGGLMYCGFLEGEKLVIASSQGSGESEFEVGVMIDGDFKKTYTADWERIIFLQPDDALRVMKIIYYHAANKKYLDRVYDHAKRKG
jgi:hypothetical protein